MVTNLNKRWDDIKYETFYQIEYNGSSNAQRADVEDVAFYLNNFLDSIWELGDQDEMSIKHIWWGISILVNHVLSSAVDSIRRGNITTFELWPDYTFPGADLSEDEINKVLAFDWAHVGIFYELWMDAHIDAPEDVFAPFRATKFWDPRIEAADTREAILRRAEEIGYPFYAN